MSGLFFVIFRKWLYNIARGIDLEHVTTRLISKSIGCCKNFPGKNALTTAEDVQHWISELASEISERLQNDLEENNRRARQMIVSFTQETKNRDSNSSRTHPLQSYEPAKIAKSAVDVIRRFCIRADGSYHITFLGLSVGNFQDLKNSVDISSLFKNMHQKHSPTTKSSTSETYEPKESVQTTTTTTQITKNNTVNSFFQSWATKMVETYTNSGEMKQLDQEPSDQETRTNFSHSSGTVNATNVEPTKSFFLNYFMNEGKHLLKPTSTIVAEPKPIPQSTRRIVEGPSDHKDAEFVPDRDKQTCPECNKEIPLGDYLSHLDYHFALKMVKNEAHLYKEHKDNIQKEHKGKKIVQKSRERPIEAGRVLTLLHKLKKEVKLSEQLEIQNSASAVPPKKCLEDDLRHFERSTKENYNSHVMMELEEQKSETISSSDRQSIDRDMFHEWKLKVPETVDFQSKLDDVECDIFGKDDYSGIDMIPNENQDDLSVYSADTEELNEDPKSFIYFEDVFSGSDSSQPVFNSEEPKRNDSNKLGDGFENSSIKTKYLEHVSTSSIVDEDRSESPESSENTTKSFFLNYFRNEGKHLIKVPVEENKVDVCEVVKKQVENSPKRDIEMQDCSECNKTIPTSEYLTHLDYHFALNLVKNERKFTSDHVMSKNEKPAKSNVKKSGQSSKRKLPESKNILTFLQKTKSEDLDENNSELCAKCNKRIKLDEAIGHADYHAAKQLHLELNAPKNLAKVKDKKKKSVMNVKTISNFFNA